MKDKQSFRLVIMSHLKLWLALLVLLVIISLGAGFFAMPILSPTLGAKFADLARSVLGPQPVAFLEGIAFRVEDTYYQVRYRLGSKQPAISFSAVQPAETPTVTNPDSTAQPPTANENPRVTPTPNNASSPAQGNSSKVAVPPLVNQQASTGTSNLSVISAPPALPGGWQAFGSRPSGQPLMARAVVSPDPERPYAQVALVRFDLSQTNLHMMAGRIEPYALKGLPKFSRPGVIPLSDQSPNLLLAGFNGGFKAVNGHFGMMVDGNIILPPLDNLATLVIYQDGSVKIGSWGRDLTYTPDMAAYRQNCPLLVDAGAINPAVKDGNFNEWGQTIKNVDATWRSGVGLSQDGRFLIYAVGNSLTVESLARALQAGGSYYAMQLDINSYHIRFVSYSYNTTGTQQGWVADKLVGTMVAAPNEFLFPYDRDFFYVTAKP